MSMCMAAVQSHRNDDECLLWCLKWLWVNQTASMVQCKMRLYSFRFHPKLCNVSILIWMFFFSLFHFFIFPFWTSVESFDHSCFFSFWISLTRLNMSAFGADIHAHHTELINGNRSIIICEELLVHCANKQSLNRSISVCVFICFYISSDLMRFTFVLFT